MTSENVSVNPHQLSPTAHFPLKKRRGRITRLIESKSPIEGSIELDAPKKRRGRPKKLDAPKKRRGRPKKLNSHSNLAKNASSHDKILRNARKSSEKCINPCYKILSSESSSSNNVDKNNIDDIDRIQCTKITIKNKKSKKRGRPRRSQIQRDSDNLAKKFLGNLRFHDNTLEISFKQKPQNVVLNFLSASD